MAKYDDEFIRKIKDLYENTDISLNQLAKREGVGKATVIKWSKGQGWIKKNSTDRPPTDQKEKRPTRSTDRKKEKETGEDKKEKAVGRLEKEIKKAKDLTEKEMLFCLYYIKDFNAGLAVKKAGYNTINNHYVIGCQLLQKPHIKKYIEELREELKTDAMLDVNRLIEHYKKLAFYDIDDFVEIRTIEKVLKNDKGAPIMDGDKPMTEEVEVLVLKTDYDGQLVSELAQMDNGSIKIKLPDRLKALDKLLDYVDIPRQVDRKRLEIEELKAQKEEETDNNIEIRITGEVKDV